MRQKRLEQALELAQLRPVPADADAGLRVILIGDFNAFEFTDGYVDVVGIVTGNLDPDGAIQPGHRRR